MNALASRASRALALALLVAAPALQGQALDSVALRTKPLFTRGDAIVAGAFVAGTLAALPFDRRIAVDLQRPGLQSDDFLRDAASTFRLLGGPGAAVAGPALYVVGRVARSPRLADLGAHGTEAVLAASAVDLLLKGLIGRARPYAVGDTMPGSLGFGRGFTGGAHGSFPSGHTTAAFAAAAAVTAETSRWWPHSGWYVAPIMYGGATMVALSRLYNDDHWASDVIAAAAIGTFTGRKLVQWQHSGPRHGIDRWLLPEAALPAGSGGFVVLWSVRE